MAQAFTRIDHVKALRWVNFKGENRNGYNRNKRKSFAVFLLPEDAERLAAEGWRIKENFNPRDESAPAEPYIEVVVNFKLNPRTNQVEPQVYRCIGRTALLLDEKMAEELDDDIIKDAHLVINPYWSSDKDRSKDFPTAYLYTGYFDIETDPESTNRFIDPFVGMYD